MAAVGQMSPDIRTQVVIHVTSDSNIDYAHIATPHSVSHFSFQVIVIITR